MTNLFPNISQSHRTVSGIAKILDRLVCCDLREIVRIGNTDPQAFQGQEGLHYCLVRGELRAESFLCNVSSVQFLPKNERKWAVETICRFYRAYFRALAICFPELKVDCLKIDLLCGVQIENSSDLVSLLKSVCCGPLSFSLKSAPLEHCPLGGSARSYLRRALRRRNGRALMFANTCLQLKKCCPKVPPSFVQKQLEKHRAAVTAVERQSETFKAHVLTEVRLILEKCELFEAYDIDHHQLVQGLSQKACVENKGFLGGGYSYYMNYEGDYDRCGNFRPLIRHYDSCSSGVATYRAKLLPTQGQLLEELEDLLIADDLTRKVVAVLEPLKVRVITIHHACETNGWGQFQLFAQKRLSRLREISTGKTFENDEGLWMDFSSDDFSRLDSVLEYFESIGESPVIVSDDASAATDTVSPDLSARATDMMISSTSELRLANYGSWRGRIQYPAKSNLPDAVQINAQLMGDRRSFVALLAIHLGAANGFFSLYNFPDEGRFVRINGDDKIIVIPRRLLDKYFNYMSNLWVINKAKTYVDRHVFSFNSQLWDIRSRKQINLLRFSLVDGVDKNGEPCKDPRIWNCIYATAPSYAREEMFRYFAASPVWHKKLAKVSARGVNWFLPEIGGGLGLKNDWSKPFISPIQKTMILAAADGNDKYRLRVAGKASWGSKPMIFAKSKSFGERVKQAEPVAKSIKPCNEVLAIHCPSLPSVRTWKDVGAEVELLWKAAFHYCDGDECEHCAQE
jgi:hypothetical protein